ncbi:MAG: PilZ domain-containing protein [Bacillota bacterium]
MDEERRQAPRVEAAGKITLILESGKTISGSVLDISEDGAKAFVGEKILPHTPCKFQIEAQGRFQISGSGAVLYASAAEDSSKKQGYSVGIRFTEISPSDVQRIRSHVHIIFLKDIREKEKDA